MPIHLTLRVVPARFARAFLDRDLLLVFFVGVVLFGTAAAVYRQTHFVVSSALGIESTGLTTISGCTNSTSRRIVGQWRGAGGAVCDYHRPVAGGALSLAACEEKKNFE